jgi:hypothetical protein
MQFFNHKIWSAALKEPDWYLVLGEELSNLSQRWNNPHEAYADEIKREVREFIEVKLLAGEIALAKTGENMDVQRQPIDTVVIHHTSSTPGYTLIRMNAVHLLNLYVPYYQNPPLVEEKHLRGSAIWSGHHDLTGRQVFYGYHWLIRMDGSAERLLPDSAIGWHAGNWDVNKRSVAICLDNDYTDSKPTEVVLQAIKGIIKSSYPTISVDRIFGHREVAKITTICPGTLFEDGWKTDIIAQLEP